MSSAMHLIATSKLTRFAKSFVKKSLFNSTQPLTRSQKMATSSTTGIPTEESSVKTSLPNVKTAILMMNMGGPDGDEVEHVRSFLLALFKDRDIIQMPFQNFLGPLIANTRSGNLKSKFDEIGGDPLRNWSETQGKGICELLDKISPDSAPHKAYLCFRYSRYNIDYAVEQLEQDQAKRVVLLSKYPQYSCSTTGSNLNDVSRFCVDVKQHMTSKPSQRWSLIDRWPMANAIVDSYADRIETELAKLPSELRDQMIILFSAHSIPLWMVNRGDDYTGEVGGTVQAVLAKLKFRNPYSLVWQSKVGPNAWQGPDIVEAMKRYVANGHKHFMVVPIAFVNEHIETLHELDIEYGSEMKSKIGFETFIRIATPNDHPKFIEGMANLVKTHLESGDTASRQMSRRCHGCTKDNCKRTRSWLARLDSINKELRD